MDHQTETHRRVRGAGRTRLALDGLGDLVAPTVLAGPALRNAPIPPEPVRTAPAPRVQPPGGYGRRNRPDPAATAVVEAAAESAATHRIRRVGPGGLFGWRPTAGPSLAEVAAARQRAADREAHRRHAHQRHMDVVETVRAYLGVICLVGLTAFVLGAAVLAFGMLAGWFVWMPVHRT